ncbi:hypothetical protein StoSoilB13_23860 [Arthrobacter sp. StoSoilB13]|nr:hypothetical protein StoSoilB13_23860 [Arthrobacter sp. StoSoilB13]
MAERRAVGRWQDHALQVRRMTQARRRQTQPLSTTWPRQRSVMMCGELARSSVPHRVGENGRPTINRNADARGEREDVHNHRKVSMRHHCTGAVEPPFKPH